MLASDPDGLLAYEQIHAALAEHGFRLIDEQDSIALRYIETLEMYLV